MRMTAEQLYPHLVPFLGDAARPLDELRTIIDLHKMRARTLRELADQMSIYFADDDAIEYDAEAVKKHIKGDDLGARLSALHETLASTEPFDVATSEAALRHLAETQGVSAGKLIHPLRLALTGKGASPPVFDVAVVLGKEKSLRRLQRLIDRLPELL
jgi:glutamyl-tRNA synthetase